MKKVMVWFLLSCKRYIKKLSFLLILLLLPLVILAVDKGQGDKGQEIKIAIAVQNGQENELGAELAEGLINRRLGRDAGMFRFYECRDEEAVKDEVASRRAECGFVVYEDFKEKLDAGNYRRSIGVYSAPSTVSASLSTETVFAALMEIYDRQLLMDYVGEESLFEQLGAPGSAQREQAAAQSGELYDKWLANGSTFRFEYSFLDQEGREQTSSDALSGTVFPVRGLVAVYVFITGLYGAVVLWGRRKGIIPSVVLWLEDALPPGVHGSPCVPGVHIRPDGSVGRQEPGSACKGDNCHGSLLRGGNGRILAFKAGLPQAPGTLLHHPLFCHRKPVVLSCVYRCR